MKFLKKRIKAFYRESFYLLSALISFLVEEVSWLFDLSCFSFLLFLLHCLGSFLIKFHELGKIELGLLQELNLSNQDILKRENLAAFCLDFLSNGLLNAIRYN